MKVSCINKIKPKSYFHFLTDLAQECSYLILLYLNPPGLHKEPKLHSHEIWTYHHLQYEGDVD